MDYVIETRRPYLAREIGDRIGEAYTTRSRVHATTVGVLESRVVGRQLSFWNGGIMDGTLLYGIRLHGDKGSEMTPKTRFEVIPDTVNQKQFKQAIDAVKQMLAGK